MTDLSLAPPIAARADAAKSKTAQDRLRARYRAEARFKFYGRAALAIAATFVFVLLADILTRGLPGFWRHTLVLDVPITADVVDPQGARDPAVLARADYFPLTRAALEAVIPGVEGRAARKTLTGLLSVGAADALRQRVANNPALVGTTVTARLVLSDDADLYFKNPATPIRSRPAKGVASPSGVSGEITISSTATDFASELRGPSGETTLDGNMPSLLVAINGGLVKATKVTPNNVTGVVLLPLVSANAAAPNAWKIVAYEVAENNRKVTDQQIAFLERFRELGKVEGGFNWRFFSAGDSREPELAGIRGALAGTALTLFITLILCVPIGVAAAVYLEEFAPKNRLTDIIEVNINNLAAVPSIVFGLLGLAVFLNFFGLPRSAPLVGGLVLALLVLPTIIIASRAALKAVPPSIKEAALAVGASHQQAIFHHVLPSAMPGIMTGGIIGMAHALGETAPLLMIGMVAFIVDVPTSFVDSATVLPVQIFLWSDLPEAAFKAKTAAAIIVLLIFLFAMNGLAIYLRRAFERRW